MQGRATTLTLCFLVGLAALPRLLGAARAPLWFDEAASYRLAVMFSTPELLERTARDVHPPLYYLALKGWGALVGTSTFELRLLSLLCALAALPLLYRVTRLMFEKEERVALIACSLFAASLLFCWQAWFARMYALTTVLMLLSTLCLLEASRRDDPKWWALWSVATAAGLYTHNFAIYMLGAQIVYLVAEVGVKRGWLLGVLGSIILYLPWLPNLVFQARRVREDYWAHSMRWEDLERELLAFFFAPESVQVWNLGGLLLLAPALVLGATLWLAVRTRGPARLGAYQALLPGLAFFLLSTSGRNIFQARYLSFSFLFALIALAWWLASLEPQPLSFTLVGVWIAVLAFSTSHFIQLKYLGRQARNPAVGELRAHHRPGDIVLVGSPFVYLVVDALAPELRPVLISGQQLADHYQGGAFLRAGERRSLDWLGQLDGDRVWVVNSDSFDWRHELSLPPPWQLERQLVVRQPTYYEEQVQLSLYTR